MSWKATFCWHRQSSTISNSRKKRIPNGVGVASKRFAQFDKKFWAIYHTRLAPLLLLFSGNKSFPLRHFPGDLHVFEPNFVDRRCCFDCRIFGNRMLESSSRPPYHRLLNGTAFQDASRLGRTPFALLEVRCQCLQTRQRYTRRGSRLEPPAYRA